jgi:putative endopeptidase
VYATRHFPRTSKVRVERIVDQILRAYRQAVAEADWLNGGARAEAHAKLALMKTRAGYPEVWRDYRGVEIRADDLFGNLARAQTFDNSRRMSRMARPDERGEWVITGPQSVNAYYVPAQNEIMLPAAILQPPYFDAAADEAANYGAIGAVIGHEIMHGLDGTGRYYDRLGASTDWWRTGDEQAFLARAQVLFEDLQRHATVDGQRINANLVIAESLSDLAGLSVAHRAYRASLGGKPAPVIDGLSGDQRFFMGWARIWRSKERPEYQRQLLLISRYAPSAYRANGTAGHIDAFYSAFDVNTGDRLFIDPRKRARIY